MDETTRNILAGFKGHAFASLITATEPKMNKTGNPYFGNVLKVTRQVVGLGYQYQTSVENREEKVTGEQSFIAESLPWGAWVPESKTMITHKGEEYLRVTVGHGNVAFPESHYINKTTGEEIPADKLAEWMPDRKGSAKQEAVGIAKEDQIKVCNYKLSTIRRIVVEGVVKFEI